LVNNVAIGVVFATNILSLVVLYRLPYKAWIVEELSSLLRCNFMVPCMSSSEPSKTFHKKLLSNMPMQPWSDVKTREIGNTKKKHVKHKLQLLRRKKRQDLVLHYCSPKIVRVTM
jgi:hypothetical protein